MQKFATNDLRMNRILLILPFFALIIISWSMPGKKSKLPKAQPATSQDSGDTTTLNDLIFSDFFSPNGDGNNDRFVIVNVMYYPANSLRVFNRWGDEVYYSSPYNNEWDGRNNRGNAMVNTFLTDGIYYYQFSDGNGNNVTGKITLKR